MFNKIIITGGAGFIGSNLAINIKKDNPLVEIICLDNLKRRGSEFNILRLKKNNIKFIHGDIRNIEDFNEVGQFDLMIECSAEPSVMAGVDSSPDYLLKTNLSGTINCLKICRKNKAKIIFLSTSRVYPIDNINNKEFIENGTRFILKENSLGITKEGISEEFPIEIEKPRSLYGFTKLSSEMLIHEYSQNYNLNFIINRCGVIAGPWQMGKVDQGVIVLWVLRHYFKKELSYIGFGGKGKQVRDFLHIDDLYDLIKMQINNFQNFNGKTFNVSGGNNNSVSLLELTSMCEKITKNKIKINSVLENRKGDIKWVILDSSKINKLCNWYPKRNLKKTINDIYNWIKENEKDLINLD
ncbi:MAG: NAD-dependent epimerase/dehydratase family protein [Spirochaetes bacterium]|nr:NAD-dependent epimerase/dehydratase family protein [Spirochaetota bacterium]